MVLELLQTSRYSRIQSIQTNCQYYFLQIVDQIMLVLFYLLMWQVDLKGLA